VQPDVYDIDRVEVLKGPQGTLFGRNSIGGVVSMYTNQPTFKNGGTAEVTYGENNLVELKGVYNAALIDNQLAARIVLSDSSVDGNVRDITTGGNLNGEHQFSARGKLLFTPTDDFKSVSSFDYLHKQGTQAEWLLGHREKGEALMEESLALCRTGGYRWYCTSTLNALGQSLLGAGHPERARALIEESLTICREFGVRTAEAWTVSTPPVSPGFSPSSLWSSVLRCQYYTRNLAHAPLFWVSSARSQEEPFDSEQDAAVFR